MARGKLDETSRIRLEGRAELLEDTQLRYRALRGILRGLFWKDRFRRNSDLVREVVASEPRVEEALLYVKRRAEHEPLDPALLTLVREVADAREELRKAASAKRKGTPGTLAEGLAALEETVLRAALSGSLLPGQRFSTAVELLPPSLPAVRGVAVSGAKLAELFSRPLPPDGRLPLSSGETAGLPALFAAAEENLAALYARLGSFDPSGSIVPFLKTKARTVPSQPPSNGAEELLRAEFWVDNGRARCRELCAERVQPVKPREAEVLPLLAYLAGREEGKAVRLSLPEAEGSTARASLLELAHELWLGLGKGRRQPHRHGLTAAEPRFPVGFWDRLSLFAEGTASAPRDADYKALEETLSLFVRIRARTQGMTLPPPNLPLHELVARAKELSAPRG